VKSNKKTRIAIVGGPDVDARIQLMRTLRSDFDFVAIGSSPHLAGRFQDAGFEYCYVPMKRGAHGLADIRYFTALVKTLRRECPDVVHTFDTKPSSLGRIAARAARVRCVIGTLPGLGSLYSAGGVRNRLLRAIYEPLQRVACHLADATVFQNPDDMKQCIEHSLVPRDRSVLIPGSGVAVDVFQRESCSLDAVNRLRAELGIAPTEIVVLMIGRVVRSKGVLAFTRLAATAKANGLRFVLVGPEDHASRDQLSASETALLKRTVQWVGPQSDIRGFQAASDIFVLPSTYREGIPRVLLEAAAMKLPLVTYDLPGCSEVVTDGVNGFLIQPGDSASLVRAVQTLAQSPEARRAFGEASRELVEKRFSLSVIAKQTAAMYRDVLSRRAWQTPERAGSGAAAGWPVRYGRRGA
jgi:glycosyltransferase involved in cell wall biosynthesis